MICCASQTCVGFPGDREMDDLPSMVIRYNHGIKHAKLRGRHDEHVDRDDDCHMFRKKLRQVGEGAFGRRGRYLPTHLAACLGDVCRDGLALRLKAKPGSPLAIGRDPEIADKNGGGEGPREESEDPQLQPPPTDITQNVDFEAGRRCSSRYSRYGVSTSSIHFMNARTRRDRLLRCATTRDTASARRRKSGMISTSAPLSKYRPIPKSGA